MKILWAIRCLYCKKTPAEVCAGCALRQVFLACFVDALWDAFCSGWDPICFGKHWINPLPHPGGKSDSVTELQKGIWPKALGGLWILSL
ncbi:MAG: hypothetical protein HDT27_01105 [Subdoligranulum sp.]|nr:hypothetical protein [Subdoligranulum sp.]